MLKHNSQPIRRGMKKSAQIKVLVTEEQKDRWQAEATKRNKSMPEFIRHCVETYIMLMKKVPQKD